MSSTERPVTLLLRGWRAGDEGALTELMSKVYGELHQLAESYMRRERAWHTLTPTALISEAFMRLAGGDLPEWRDRAHFFGIAARHMRQILVDSARARLSRKRAGAGDRVAFDDDVAADARCEELIALDEALVALTARDPRMGRVIELHYYGGLGQQEIGEVLGVSVSTVARDQKLAEAWLHREIRGAR